MPDTHAGKGMPIGGVIACKNVVIPNAVGVDIGCGMCAVKTNIRARRLTEKILRKVIMKGIRERIPLGMDHHEEMQDEKYLPTGFDLEKLPVVKNHYKSIHHQVGTLGGGNHFIELQHDEDGWLWIMIHSGSRNLGKQVGDFYNKKAKWFNELYYSKVESELMLPFLPLKTPEFKEYWDEMNYCIAFAKCNRQLMMERIKEVIVDALPLAEFEPTIDIAHNYAAFENHFGHNCIVHRKGAVRARAGEIGTHTMIWRPVISDFLSRISWINPNLVYVLSGGIANSFKPYIGGNKGIISTVHPSFCIRTNTPFPDVFNSVNAFLRMNDKETIKWM